MLGWHTQFRGRRYMVWGHHHENFDIDERALTYATEIHVRYVLDFLSQND